MKKCIRKLVFAGSVLIGFFSHGQNEFFFNHYMFNPSYFNPAWVGSESEAFVAAHHRSQWAGYNASLDPGGAPTTQLLSLVVPVEGKFSGFGLSVSNDQTGPLTSVQARVSIAITNTFRFGSLSLGIMPSMNVASVNAAYFRFNDQDDQLIPEANESQIKPNLHAGVFFESRANYFIGASVENLLEPSFSFGTEAGNTITRNYLLMLGRPFGLSRELILKPTVLVRSDLKSYSADVSIIAEYKVKMWGGVAFRRAESVSLLLGYSFLKENKLKAGYSFDYVIREQDAKEPTSHEIFIRYNLPGLVFGGRKAIKTPRFTF